MKQQRPMGVARVTGSRRALAAGCAAALIGWAVAFSGAFARARSSESVERGRRQFEQSCGFCHGPDATGARGPDLLRSKIVADDVNGNLVGEVIRDGRPDKGMPALPLSADQIRDVAAFLHARARQALASNRVPTVYPLSRLLTGSAEAGRVYFNGAGGCRACHSPTGDLAHVAGRYSPPNLEARMLYPRRAARPTVTVTLASGEQLSGPLVHLDDFTVSLRGPSGWYRSFARDQVKVAVHDPLAAHQALLSKLTEDDVHNLFAYLETLK